MTAGEVLELSEADRRAHAEDEEIIAAGLATFVEVGRALLRIRDRRSYLLTHTAFGPYVRDRWRFNGAYAYNLMAGAEVITVLEGEVEILPANARVAYELRNLVDQPEELVATWRQALETYGEKPLGREVARVVRGDQPPLRGQLPRRTEPEPDSSTLTKEQQLFLRALEEITERLELAKRLQEKALADLDGRTRLGWSRRVKRARTMAADLQRALDRKL